MKVLSVTSECAPLVKTGGLADVAGALPGALAEHGVEMRTLLPGYPKVMAALRKPEPFWNAKSLMGGPARVLAARAGGLDLFVLDAPHLFDRPGGPYQDERGDDFPDNPERFAALGQAAIAVAREWNADLLHCHDWQAGLAPYYARETDVPSVLTIHNIAFQGMAPPERLDALGLDERDFTRDGFEFWSQISALKAGLVWADRITTVSPTYARELTSPEFGFGFDGLLRHRNADLSGILNGIDMQAWDPRTDPQAGFSTPRGKGKCKRKLRRAFELPESEGPLAVVVSRLSQQKGLDLLLDALPAFVDRGGQIALLGSGDRILEHRWQERAAGHPHVAVKIGYDEPLSHLMYAGADAVLVPSRFEPCGLTQMYGLRYGALPCVARTGGLADTVVDANPAALLTNAATGFVHAPDNVHALAGRLMDMIDLWNQPDAWASMQVRAMKAPVGWDRSAKAYADLYASLTSQ